MDYKLVIFGSDIYKEIELDSKLSGMLLIGTTPDCSIRFNKEHFFQDFEISIEQKNGEWVLGCRENVCFKTGGILKQSFITVAPGDSLIVCYEKNDGHIFSVDFMIDDEREAKTFDTYVDLQGLEELYIGSQDSASARNCLFIHQAGCYGGTILRRNGSGWCLYMLSDKISVYKNGYKAQPKGQMIDIGDRDFFSVSGQSFYISGTALYFTQTGRVQTTLPTYNQRESGNMLQYPRFLRNARVEYVTDDSRIDVLAPKSMSAPPKKNLLMTILPVVAALILMVALRGVMGGGGMFVLYSGATMALGGIMSVWTYFNDGKEYKKNMALREEKYNLYIQGREEKLCEQRATELAVMNYTYTSLQQDAEFVRNFDSRLFERRPKDRDFLAINLGKGSIKTALPVKCKEVEYKDVDDPLQDYPVQLRDKYAFLENAPVVLDLKTVSSVGIMGNDNKLYQLLKNMVIDLAVRHYYTDVKFYFIFPGNKQGLFEWMRWFRNAYNGETDSRSFMFDEESEKRGLEFLYGELSLREQNASDKTKDYCRYIVFVMQSKLLKSHPISKYMAKAADLGFTFIFMENYREFLDDSCNVLITLDENSSQGCLIDCRDGQHMQMFTYDHISSKNAAECALKLGSIYVDEVSLEKSLTKNISLFTLFGIINAEDMNLKRRWATSKIYESMAAPLGVKSGNEIVYLDLHEKFHGPHGLVAGTTGSGKSEILQSYILSMATLFHPYDVGFVIIDFKGGGMVNQFKNLPHLNGAITNIDENEIERSLLSIRAELLKRQALFARYEVNHIDAYIKKYKNKETDTPLPHLILIVDEFAELKSDQPEFMKELISTARIGRSLGVHLILATQKPSGVVDNQIWSNSKFKLCLKVQNKEDSTEVLKSPLAAEIKEPGRAYLQVGNNEIFTLFQSAYSGAPEKSDSTGNQRSYEISKISLSGARECIYKQKAVKSDGGRSQLEAVVDYVRAYCELNHIQKLPGICLPPLPEDILWPEQSLCDSSGGITVPLGLMDDPEHQLQKEVKLNLTEGHVFILGAARYGKTNVLQTMIHGLARLYTPQEVNIYIIDLASMVLKRFEGLAHVGGVITSMDDEKMKTFMKMMDREIKRRKEVLLRSGLGSFSSYKQSGHKQLAQIVIMIDNMTAFRELFEKYEDRLLTLCREGLSLGICVVAANLVTAGFGYKYLSNFSSRISLYCNDSNEYSYLFDHCRRKLKNIPGRALTELSRKIYELQIYRAFAGEDELEQGRLTEEEIQRINRNNRGMGAEKIPEIPSILTRAYIDRNFPEDRCQPYEIYLGINYATTRLEKISMLNQGTMGLSGTPHMGKTNFISYMLNTLAADQEQAPVECYILDSVDRKLQVFEELSIVKACSSDASEYKMMLGYFIHVMEERYQWMVDGKEEYMERAPLLIWLIQNNDVISEMSGDREMMKQYRQLCTKYKALKICIIYTDLENAAINYNAPEALKMLRDNRNFLVFTDIEEQKLCDVAFSVSKEYSKPLEAGEAYRFIGSSMTKIKTVLDEREVEELG